MGGKIRVIEGRGYYIQELGVAGVSASGTANYSEWTWLRFVRIPKDIVEMTWFLPIP